MVAGIPARRALEIAVYHGRLIVNPLRNHGNDRMARAAFRAKKRGWLRVDGGSSDALHFTATEAGRALLSSETHPHD